MTRRHCNPTCEDEGHSWRYLTAKDGTVIWVCRRCGKEVEG